MGKAGGIECLSKKNKKLLDENLQKGETVEFCLVGGGDQVIIALDNRLIILKSGIMAGATFGSRVTSFYYTDITGFEINTGLINGVIEINTPSYEGTRQKDFWSMSKDRDPWKMSNCLPIAKLDLGVYQPYLEKLRIKIDTSKQLKTSNERGVEMSKELEKLAELASRGILSEDEFKQAKRRLLES